MPPKVTKKPRNPVVLPEDDDAFVRLSTVLAVFPVGETSWWNGIRRGDYPKPIKLSTRVNGWRVREIRELLSSRG